MPRATVKRHLPRRARGGDHHIPKQCPSHKRAFIDRSDARRFARAANGAYGIRYKVYRCRHLPRGVKGEPCGQYHVATIVKEEPQ